MRCTEGGYGPEDKETVQSMFRKRLSDNVEGSPDITLEGITLHHGAQSTVRLRRQLPGTGLRLRRVDLEFDQAVRVRPSLRRDAARRTVIAVGSQTVETTEHLFAALAGLGHWDVEIAVDGPEIPILDGSARPWVEALALWAMPTPVEPIAIQSPLTIKLGESSADLEPADALEIICDVDFAHPAVGHQRAMWDGTPATFRREIAPARTFGFADELDSLRADGLIAGGSLETALVFDAEGPLIEPRFPNEPARHKLLDAIGDLALLGRPLQAKVELRRPGHALIGVLLRAIGGCRKWERKEPKRTKS